MTMHFQPRHRPGSLYRQDDLVGHVRAEPPQPEATSFRRGWQCGSVAKTKEEPDSLPGAGALQTERGEGTLTGGRQTGDASIRPWSAHGCASAVSRLPSSVMSGQ